MFLRSFAALVRVVVASLLVTLTGIGTGSAFADKYAAIVIDADTQDVLHARNADEPRYPASLTKVMTLYMLFDALKSGELSLNDQLTVSRYAASQAPSNLRLKPNSTITVKQAINALITKSANDVAVVVAERLGRTERRFAQLMTVKAQSLGMTNTHFVNASGLPDTRQISTARDLAILAEAMLRDHADYYHYFADLTFTWGGRTYKNHNNLLGTVDGVDGIKTGYTRASGFNLMASAERDGHRVIAVMLGGSTAKARDSHVEALMEAAFNSFALPVDPNDPTLRTRVAFAELETPRNMDDAAVPMLNGKPITEILAKESPGVALAALMATPSAQGDVDGDDDGADVLPATLTSATASPAVLEVNEVTPAPVAEPAPSLQAPVLTEQPALTPDEYLRRQMNR
ncbi:MAG: D-alanyl-D-alanine carboxypeptidase [Hyphomonas sp.]|nr:D-alanyl-D-alanine carboxypeptidase [Hyphomonas sp.]MCB9970004.1 D-alanyl-D-alanine carboxypeptidase [Hyphomonas sp.]